MPKTHLQIVETFEERLLHAMTAGDKPTLYELIHPDCVYTNENGEIFKGLTKFQINEPEMLRIKTIDIQERSISFFNNVAVVSTFENRTGEFRSMHFEREYRVTRIWKFHTKGWHLIAASVVLL